MKSDRSSGRVQGSSRRSQSALTVTFHGGALKGSPSNLQVLMCAREGYRGITLATSKPVPRGYGQFIVKRGAVRTEAAQGVCLAGLQAGRRRHCGARYRRSSRTMTSARSMNWRTASPAIIAFTFSIALVGHMTSGRPRIRSNLGVPPEPGHLVLPFAAPSSSRTGPNSERYHFRRTSRKRHPRTHREPQ